MPGVHALCKETIILIATVHIGTERIDLIRCHYNPRCVRRAESLTDCIQIIDFTAKSADVIRIGENTLRRVGIHGDAVF